MSNEDYLSVPEKPRRYMDYTGRVVRVLTPSEEYEYRLSHPGGSCYCCSDRGIIGLEMEHLQWKCLVCGRSYGAARRIQSQS